ncbi:interferon-induced, double-stranded RNA-activated protein kinase-like isoform X2 [Hyperolius riggenbachi]
MDQNFKGQLISHCDRLGLTMRCEEVDSTGPAHDRRFTFHVFVNDEKLGEGQHKTKKAATNNACKMALLTLQEREQAQNRAQPQVTQPYVLPPTPPATPSAIPSTSASTPQSAPQANGVPNVLQYEPNYVGRINYVGRFNEFCQRKGWKNYNFDDQRQGPDHIPEFFRCAVIGQRKFPEGKGKNKKEAKQSAARLALKVLRNEHPDSLELKQIPGLDDADIRPQESTSASESTGESSASSSISRNQTSDPETSDSQVEIRRIPTAITPASSRPHRRVELAAKFPNQEQVNCEPINQEQVNCKPANEEQVNCKPANEEQVNCKPANQEQVNRKPTTDLIFQKDFDKIKILDSGGFGTVYGARKILDQKYYAVKKVKKRSEKDVSEILALSSLEHKHIVRYFHSWDGEDVFSEDSCSFSDDGFLQKCKCLFIQMEWCPNGTLAEWIEKMGKVDRQRSLNIFRQIVDGVEYIHSKKLIHRDLKPSNILFAENMVVKIADFGLVTPMSEEQKEERMQRTAGIGTERYMAPEQEKDAYENEVDIYPLGLILIELFWIFGTIHARQKEWGKLRNGDLPPTFVKQFPAEEHMIKLMLSREPKKRPTAADLRSYFEAKSVFNSMTR